MDGTAGDGLRWHSVVDVAVPPASLSVMMRTRGCPGIRPHDLAGAPGPGGITPGADPIIFIGAGM